MLKSRKKRVIADRDNGFVFRWRGGTQSNTGGFIIAMMVVLACFAFALSVLEVRVRKDSFNTQRTARVSWLSNDSLPENERLQNQKELWKPSEDADVLARLQGKWRTSLFQTTYQKPTFISMPDTADVVSLPEVIPPGMMHIPEVVTTQRVISESSYDCALSVKLVSQSNTGDAFKYITPFHGLVDKELLGRSERYLLRVSADGRVIKATRLTDSTLDIRGLQVWIESIRMNPSDTVRVFTVQVCAELKKESQILKKGGFR